MTNAKGRAVHIAGQTAPRVPRLPPVAFALLLLAGCMEPTSEPVGPGEPLKSPPLTFVPRLEACEGNEAWLPTDLAQAGGALPEGYIAATSLDDFHPFLGLTPVPYAGRLRILAIECTAQLDGADGPESREPVRLAVTSVLLAASQGPMRSPKTTYASSWDHDEFVFEAFIDGPPQAIALWRGKGWAVEPAAIAIADGQVTIQSANASYSIAVGPGAQFIDNNSYTGERFHALNDGAAAWWDIDGGRVDRYGPQRDCRVEEATGALRAIVPTPLPWPCLDPMFSAEGNVTFHGIQQT